MGHPMRVTPSYLRQTGEQLSAADLALGDRGAVVAGAVARDREDRRRHEAAAAQRAHPEPRQAHLHAGRAAPQLERALRQHERVAGRDRSLAPAHDLERDARGLAEADADEDVTRARGMRLAAARE